MRRIGVGLMLLALTGCVTEKTIIIAAPSREKPTSATAVVKGARVPYELWFDERKWRREENPTNKEAEYELRGNDMYGQVIAERIAVPIENLRRAIISNAKRGGVKDVSLIREERRFVNGAAVLYLQVEGTAEGVPLVWLIHAYSGQRGTIQVMTFTAKNLFDELRKDMEGLLDGLVVKE